MSSAISTKAAHFSARISGIFGVIALSSLTSSHRKPSGGADFVGGVGVRGIASLMPSRTAARVIEYAIQQSKMKKTTAMLNSKITARSHSCSKDVLNNSDS